MADRTTDRTLELDTSTRLAYDRTRLAYERSMMAWVRTAASLITFGFSLYKFFEFQKTAGQVERLFSPRIFGMTLIGLGLVSLFLATVQHVTSMRQLRAHYAAAPRSMAAVLAALISILGITAFIAALLRQ